MSWPRRSDRAFHDVDCFLTKTLVHHDTDRAALAEHSDVHEWTLGAYDALLELARNPQSNSAMTALDDIRSRFDQSSEMFGRLLTENEVALEEARRQVEELSRKQTDALSASERARISQAARLEALRGQLIDAEAALAGARKKQAPKGFRAWLTSRDPRQGRLARRLLRSGLFDAEFYRMTYLPAPPEASRRAAKGDRAAAEHYLIVGFRQGCRPNPLFDTRWYLERYDDVRRSGVNPLLHYLRNGFREGRDPGPEFNTRFYLEANPDVRHARMNPLARFLRHGRDEGRPAAPSP